MKREMDDYSESNRDFLILDHLPTGHCVLAATAEILFWNHTLEVWTGVPAQNTMGRDLFEAFPNLLDPRIKNRLDDALRRGVPAVFSHHIAPQFFPSLRIGGDQRIFNTTLDRIEPDEDGSLRLLLTVMDVTDQVKREERVRTARFQAEEEVRNRKLSEERFRTLVELTSDAIFVATPEGRITDCNSASGLLFLRPWDEFEGSDLRSLVPPNHRHIFERILAGEGADAERVEGACLRGDGTSFPAEISARAFQVGVGRHIVTYIHDLTLQKKAEEALRKANEALENLSFTDPLTGLRNRRFFEAYITRDAARTVRAYEERDPAPRKDILFFLVDLDHFKHVNDTFGHAAGDAVLQELAAILTSAMRQTDLVVRWGGEEFLLVAREASRAEGPLIAERVRRSVERHLFDLGTGEVLRRTCSIGWAPYPFLQPQPKHLSVEDVVAIADHGLYAAKRSGRNAWVGLEGQDSLAPKNRGALLAEIPQLIDAGHVKTTSNLTGDRPVLWEG